MTLLRLKNLKVYRDRNGTVRRYFRRRRQKDLPLKVSRDLPSSCVHIRPHSIQQCLRSIKPRPERSRGSSSTTAGPQPLPTSTRHRRNSTSLCSIVLPSGMGIAGCATPGAATAAKPAMANITRAVHPSKYGATRFGKPKPHGLK